MKQEIFYCDHCEKEIKETENMYCATLNISTYPIKNREIALKDEYLGNQKKEYLCTECALQIYNDFVKKRGNPCNFKKDAFTYLRALYFLTVDFISGLDSTKCIREIYMTSETEEEARIDAFQRFSNLQAQEHMDITKCWLSVSFPTGITKIIEVLKDDEVKK